MEKILPSLVLMCVCAVVCGLLALANMATADKIEQAQAEKVQASLISAFGEDTYTTIDIEETDGINAVYESSDGIMIFDITTSGYSKNGINVLIGVDTDGSISGIGIVSLSETAGLGTKINDSTFLAKYVGIDDITNAPDGITGATYSSNGLKTAVELALTSFTSVKEAMS